LAAIRAPICTEQAEPVLRAGQQRGTSGVLALKVMRLRIAVEMRSLLAASTGRHSGAVRVPAA
jgi:hypothetical protein